MSDNFKDLLNEVYRSENIMNTALSKIALIAQKYTDIELHGDYVAGDGAVLSWDDSDYNHNVIAVDTYFEKVKKNPNAHFTETDLRFMSI